MARILLWYWIVCALALTAWAQEAVPQDQLPQCAQTCQSDILLESSCGLDYTSTDPAKAPDCYCSSQSEIYEPLRACVQNSCSLEDLMVWQKTRARTCGIKARDISHEILVTCCTLFVFSTLACTGRLLSRSKRFGGPGFWWDDWAVLVLYILSIEMLPDVIVQHQYKAGVDVTGSAVSVGDVYGVTRWCYISVFFYFAGTYGSKLVFSLLYLRMWKTPGLIRYACWFMASLAVIGIFAASIATLSVRWPIDYYIGDTAVVRQWQLGVNIPAATYAFSALNIVADFYVLLLPIPMLGKLRGLTRSRRMGIYVVFLAGFIATAASVVRLAFIPPLTNSTNVTWDFGLFMLVCQIEVHISMMCVNTPTWTGLIRRTFIRVRSGKLGRSTLETLESNDSIQISAPIQQEERLESEEEHSKDRSTLKSSNEGELQELPRIAKVPPLIMENESQHHESARMSKSGYPAWALRSNPI